MSSNDRRSLALLLCCFPLLATAAMPADAALGNCATDYGLDLNVTADRVDESALFVRITVSNRSTNSYAVDEKFVPWLNDNGLTLTIVGSMGDILFEYPARTAMRGGTMKRKKVLLELQRLGEELPPNHTIDGELKIQFDAGEDPVTSRSTFGTAWITWIVKVEDSHGSCVGLGVSSIPDS